MCSDWEAKKILEAIDGRHSHGSSSTSDLEDYMRRRMSEMHCSQCVHWRPTNGYRITGICPKFMNSDGEPVEVLTEKDFFCAFSDPKDKDPHRIKENG